MFFATGPARLFAFAPEDVTEARLAFALRPEFMRSQNARLPPVGAGMAQMRAFGSFSIMPAKTLKPEPRKCSVTSGISIGLRRSGLSEPYLAMAVS